MKSKVLNLWWKALRVVSLCLSVSATVFAQQKPDGGELSKLTLVRTPLLYNAPSGKEEGLGCKRIMTGEGFWAVYSDRDENQTYLDKTCSSKPYMRIDFLDRFIVAQESEDAVRLVRFDPSNQPFEDKPGSKKGEFQFKKGAESEDVGWIKKKYLLLWNNALVDDSTNYTVKAISVKRLEEKADIAQIIKKGILDLYNNPAEDPKFDAKKDINLFQYLFVFKREGNMVLLANKNKVSTSSINDDILGWAPVKQLHIWDNAVCLRINFENDAVQERKSKGIDVQFFRDVTEAKNFRDKGIGSSLPFYYADPTKEIKDDNPYLLGFPIIGKVDNEKGIYKTGYVTNTINDKGVSVFTARKQAALNGIYESIKQNKQNVQIVFVLDGSLRNTFRTVTASLSAISYVGGGSNVTRNDYKMGAVVFNDASCEDDAFKVIDFMTDKDNFNEKLNAEASKVSPCQMNRGTDGAPLYAAIKKACDLFGNSSTTNIIVVVGSTTDKDKLSRSVALQAIIDKQAKMNFSQVVNKDGELYDGYIRDCKFFLEKTGEALDQKYYKEEVASGKRKPAKVLTSDNYAYLENSVATGTFNWKDKGETFSAEEMKKIIRRLITENERKMNDLLSRYEVNTTGADKGLQDGNEEETKQLMAMFMDKGISEKDIEILASQQNFQLFIAAYAPLTTSKLNEPLLLRTLFMSRKEFERLNETFESLNSTYSAGAMRENVVNTYKEIILKYKGGNIDVNMIADRFKLEDFMKLVTGLSGLSNNPLFKKSLSDIKNEKKTTQQEIESLKSSFYAIHKKLLDIKKNKLFKIEQEEGTFYWVPETAFQTQ